MGRALGPKCKVCRRLGVKLFLKGSRCESVKCAMEKRDKPPGQHGEKRQRFTDYGVHMREAQRAKKMYGLTHRPFTRMYREANRQPGNTGDFLMVLLERRLDNILFRMHFALSRDHARQLITHGHVSVNAKRVYTPSYLVEEGDVVTPSKRKASQKLVGEALKAPHHPAAPSWVKLQEEPPQGTVLRLPTLDEIQVPLDRQLIVEYMSR